MRELRKRQIVQAFELSSAHDQLHRHGAYWSIRGSSVGSRHSLNATSALEPPALECSLKIALELAQLPTRLAALNVQTARRLVNLGYQQTDACVRRSYLGPSHDGSCCRLNIPIQTQPCNASRGEHLLL